ncbi:hypothetical protein DICA3_F10220 [Diutina catenulata]
MSGESKSTFELEPNPFEHSFANNEDKDGGGDDAAQKKSNKHNLRINNISSITSNKLPGITPPIFTPGGRKLPPLGLSPGNPDTPGHMWSSLLNATNQSDRQKSGLTPNESNLRSGLTPGAVQSNGGFPFPQAGSTTPSGMMNNPMTPGLSSLLGLNPHQEEKKPAEPAIPSPVAEQAPAPAPKTKRAKVSKPKTTRRKRNSTSSPEAPKEEPGEDKRKSFLERNRVAASKCRQRKKQLIQKMEDELAFYSTGYRELSAQVGQLREQVVKLTQVLGNHKDCQLLVQQVGGFEPFNQLLNQASYVTQISAAINQGNLTSMPSTIPTTLNVPTAPQQYPAPVAIPSMEQAPRAPVMVNDQQAAHGNMAEMPAPQEGGNMRNMQAMGTMQRPEELEGLALDMAMVQPN